MDEDIKLQKSTEKILLNHQFELDNLKEITNIRKQLNISDEDFSTYLEIMSFSREKLIFDKGELYQFKLDFQLQNQQTNIQDNFVTKIKPKSNSKIIQIPTNLQDQNLVTAKDRDYEKRTTKSTNILTYNPSQLPEVLSAKNNQQFRNMDIMKIDQEIKPIQGYENYLFNDIEKMKKQIMNKIEFFKKLYEEYIQINYQINVDWWDGVTASTQDVYIVGRIASEEEGKLSKESVLFEVNDLKRFKLDLSKIKDYILFPNQVIAINGLIDSSQGKIDVWQIFQKTVQQINCYPENGQNKNPDEAVTIFIASGPYTQQDSISYKPLDDLIQECRDKKPSYLILTGPFLDCKNKVLQTGNIEIKGEFHDYETLIKYLMNKLQEQLLYTKIFIVPSPNDIHSLTPIPQMAYNYGQNKEETNITFLQNPCRLELNGEATIQILQSDLMIDLMSSQCLVEGSYNLNKLRFAMEQIIHQRSIVPLYPCSNVVDFFNFNNIVLWKEDQIPNIVIIPSYFKQNVELINQSLFINPGILCKGTQGGTYAVLHYFTNNSLSVENKTRIEFKSI